MNSLSTDQQLAESLRGGDGNAFREIYQAHWWHLYRIALRKLRSKEAAEEVVQDMFTSLWLKRDQIHLTGSWSAYLSAAVHYAVINHLKNALVREKYLRRQQPVASVAGNPTDGNLSLQELQFQLDRSLEQLPDKARKIFVMSRYQHQSNREIAHQMELSEKAVEYHITRVLKQLRLHLKDFLTSLLILAGWLGQ